jgi:hypothetical protein
MGTAAITAAGKVISILVLISIFQNCSKNKASSLTAMLSTLNTIVLLYIIGNYSSGDAWSGDNASAPGDTSCAVPCG